MNRCTDCGGELQVKEESQGERTTRAVLHAEPKCAKWLDPQTRLSCVPSLETSDDTMWRAKWFEDLSGPVNVVEDRLSETMVRELRELRRKGRR